MLIMGNNLNNWLNGLCKFAVMLCMATLLFFGASLVSCDKVGGKSENAFVISEIMASNHTGLCAQNGNLYDWIEIKNTSSGAANLGKLSLIVTDKAGKKNNKSKKKQWQFPDIEVKPGECVLVFASKEAVSDSAQELHANFKLPSDGATVKLMAEDEVVNEVKYPHLEDDQCYRLVAGSTYEVSYEQTPGFDNTREGVELYNTAVDKQRQGPLRLWELLSKPEGEDAKSWVEIKNVSSSPVDLKDYCLTTSSKELNKWQLPDVQLQPGQLYVIDSNDPMFKIGGGKEVMLTQNGKFVDGIAPKLAPIGVSVGRCEGRDGMFFFTEPSRGADNISHPLRYVAQKPFFAVKPGVYSGKNEMSIALNTHGATVHYTLDGTKPSPSSPVYKDTIKITKTTTVRAYAEGDSTTLPSHVATGTYIFDEQHGKEGFSEDCQLAIFGGYSRFRDKKCFKIRFKNTDGPSHIFYDLFDLGKSEKFKKFVLRSGSQDDNGVMARDEFFTSLMKANSPSMLVQDYRPVALYINGGYFGLYYIREKIDEHFVARHLKVSNDSAIVRVGSDSPEILSFIASHNLEDPANYQWINQRYDLMSLADQRLGEIYCNNTDVCNVKYVYSPDPAGDRKWHVVFFDLDWSWFKKTTPANYLFMGGAGEKRNTCNKLINAVIKNKDFRTLFLERLSLHMHKTFTVENTTAVFDQLINTIKPEMKRNCERWPKLTYEKWEKNGYFRAKPNPDKEPFTIVIPPPNIKKYFADLGF